MAMEAARPEAKTCTQQELDAAADQADSEITGSQAALDQVRPAADAIPEHELVPYRGNLPLVRTNIVTGVGNLVAAASRYASFGFNPSEFEHQLVVLDALAYALVLKRLAGPPDPSELPQIKSRAYRARRVMLSSLESIAVADDDAELLRKHDAIRKGRGFIDNGGDAVTLAEVFSAHAERFAGRTPVTRELIVQADADGRALVALVKPKGAPSAPTNEAPTPEDVLIDRLWSLLVAGHQRMRQAGYLTWGDDFNRFVPALLSREAPPPSPPVSLG